MNAVKQNKAYEYFLKYIKLSINEIIRKGTNIFFFEPVIYDINQLSNYLHNSIIQELKDLWALQNI
jgi:hypothetical protein